MWNPPIDDYFVIQPPWLATLQQAKRFGKASKELGISPEELFDLVLEAIGNEKETRKLAGMLWPQLEWMLDGKNPTHAPYFQHFIETSEYPFRSAFSYNKVEQKVVPIFEFFDHYLWEAVSEVRASRK